MSQEGPKIAPRWPQDGPRTAPGRPQDGPRTAPGRAKMTPRGTRMAPRCLQNGRADDGKRLCGAGSCVSSLLIYKGGVGGGRAPDRARFWAGGFLSVALGFAGKNYAFEGGH